MNVIDKIRAEGVREDLADFAVGDGVKVYVNIVEGENKRVQVFAGTVIARSGSGTEASFTVRRVTAGNGVERVFALASPMIAKIEVVRKGDVRSAKLYYLRDKVGKAARVKEMRDQR